MSKRNKTARELHEEWLKNPDHMKADAALEVELARADAFIRVLAEAALTQAQLAGRIGTTQAVIARLKSGRVKPSTRTLERFAEATGTRLRIAFDRPRTA